MVSLEQTPLYLSSPYPISVGEGDCERERDVCIESSRNIRSVHGALSPRIVGCQCISEALNLMFDILYFLVA